MGDAKSALEAAIIEIKSFPLFLDVSEVTVSKLCEGGQIVVSSHRNTLFHFGEVGTHFGVVISGAYKLSRPTPQGEDAIVHFSTPGDVIAAFIMAQPAPKYPVTATAMGPSRYLRIPRQTYLSHWKNHPDMIFRVQNLLSTRMGQMQNQKAQIKAPLAAKVATLLVELLNKHDHGNEMMLPLPLTRKEIADSLGASVESVIRVMSDWSKQGFIQTSDQQIKVIKPEKIIAEMNCE